MYMYEQLCKYAAEYSSSIILWHGVDSTYHELPNNIDRWAVVYLVCWILPLLPPPTMKWSYQCFDIQKHCFYISTPQHTNCEQWCIFSGSKICRLCKSNYFPFRIFLTNYFLHILNITNTWRKILGIYKTLCMLYEYAKQIKEQNKPVEMMESVLTI